MPADRRSSPNEVARPKVDPEFKIFGGMRLVSPEDGIHNLTRGSIEVQMTDNTKVRAFAIPEGLAADSAMKRSAMMFTDHLVAIEKSVGEYTPDRGCPPMFLVASFYFERSGDGKSATQGCRMSTREQTNIILGMLCSDSILRIENMPGAIPGLYNGMAPSINYAMGVSMRAPSTVGWYKSAASNVVKSNHDKRPDLIQRLVEDLLSNQKHANQPSKKADTKGRDWHPKTTFLWKPEKLLLENIAFGYHSNADYEVSVAKLKKIFPANDRTTMHWRQKFFQAMHSPMSDYTTGGCACYEMDKLWFEGKKNLPDDLQFPGIKAVPNDSSLFEYFSITDYPTRLHQPLWLNK